MLDILNMIFFNIWKFFTSELKTSATIVIYELLFSLWDKIILYFTLEEDNLTPTSYYISFKLGKHFYMKKR